MQGLRLEHASADLHFLLSDPRRPQLPHRLAHSQHKTQKHVSVCSTQYNCVSVSAELINLQNGVIQGCGGAG